MEGRPIRGEGIEHEQDYIAERLTYAGDVDEYEAAAEKLKQEAADLERLNQQIESSNSGSSQSST